MRVLATVVVGLVLAAASFGLFWLRRRLEHSTVAPRSNAPLVAAAIGCLTTFILVNVLDWPGGMLTSFWIDHPIVAATASTLPLVGVGYFAFEAYDTRTQGELDRKVAAAGRSGVVDHLVDVDVALALPPSSESEVREVWTSFDRKGRPLRWLREHRDRLGESDGRPKAGDPRALQISDDVECNAWCLELIDQCVRRVMAGVREWGPILSCSRDGREDLIRLGGIRHALIDLAGNGPLIEGAAVRCVQQNCRDLAWELERRSGTTNPRPELLHSMTVAQEARGTA